MDDQSPESASSEATQPWATARRLREPAAWALLVLTAVVVLVSAGQLLGLVAVPVPPSPASAFTVRAAAMGPQFVDFGLIVLPVLSVILVVFAGGQTDRARQVVTAAVWTQAVALAFGVVSWLASLGTHLRPDAWFIFFFVDLALAATALAFTAVVMRSPLLRPPTPDYLIVDEDDEDYDDDQHFGDDQPAYSDDQVDFGDNQVEFGAP